VHHEFLDRFSRVENPINELPVTLKVAVTFYIIVANVLCPIVWIYPFLAISVFLSGVALASKIPMKFLFRRILFFEPFVIVASTLALLQAGGSVRFASILVKSTLSLIAVILFSNTTPFTELIIFLRRIRIPNIFLTILALMYRYIFVLIDEMERIQRARQSRTYAKGFSRRWIVMSTVLGQLFLRSTERAERIYAAMCARGWRQQ